MYPDWTRLMDFAKKVEAIRCKNRAQSTSSLPCATVHEDGACWITSSQSNIALASGAFTNFPFTFDGSKILPCNASIKEPNTK